MNKSPITRLVAVAMAVAILAGSMTTGLLAAPPGNEHFQRTWERTDRPVAEGHADRTWMWGPEAFTGVLDEPYQQSPGGSRQVQYFDKSRMEITNPNADSSSIWYVTNGLLVVELITGKMQVGDDQFVERSPAQVNVAGDADDPTGPTYATFEMLLDMASRGHGKLITDRLDRSGNITSDPSLGDYGMGTAVVDEVTDHAIAYPFWAFMGSNGSVYEDGYRNENLFENVYFATGRPITEAYWASVKVGGVYKDVLMQCFERRCLTFTPGNPPGWQVEAGNVGQHYYEWRYGNVDDNEHEEPTPAPTPTPSPTPSPTPDPLPDTATAYAFVQRWGENEVDITIDNPTQVAIAPLGEIYVAATERHQILKFAPNGELLAAWPERSSAGSEEGKFNSPTGIAVDIDGYVFVADYGNDRIQKFNASGDFVTSWGATGAAKGNFDGPYAVSVGRYAATDKDTLYVTDLGNNRVQQFSLSGDFISSWGSFGDGPAELSSPHGITAVGPHIVFIADTGNSRIQMRNSLGDVLGNFGSPGTKAGELLLPVAVGFFSNGEVLVSELGNDRVQKFDANTGLNYEHAGYLGTNGSGPGAFDNPQGIGIDVDGNVYIADSGNNRLQIFDETGVFVDALTDGNYGRLDSPFNIEIGPDGRVFVADPTIDALQVFMPDGTFVDRWGPELDGTKPLVGPRDITFDRDGNAYVLDASRVVKLTSTGEYLGQAVAPLEMGSNYSLKSTIAVDALGTIYVADTDNMRIRTFAADLSFIADWDMALATGVPEFYPIDIATYGHEVFVFELNGRVTVLDRDGYVLRDWMLTRNEASPFGLVAQSLAIDLDGYVYTADASNLIQKFTPHGDFITSIAEPGTGEGQLDVVHGLAVDAELRVYASETLIQGDDAGIEVFAPVN